MQAQAAYPPAQRPPSRSMARPSKWWLERPEQGRPAQARRERQPVQPVQVQPGLPPRVRPAGRTSPAAAPSCPDDRDRLPRHASVWPSCRYYRRRREYEPCRDRDRCVMVRPPYSKRVLGLRGAEAARQQEHGDSETLLHCCDLLSRESHPPKLLRSDSFTQRDPDHFQSISRVLAALVQIRLGSLICRQWTVNFRRKQACPLESFRREVHRQIRDCASTVLGKSLFMSRRPTHILRHAGVDIAKKDFLGPPR